MTRDELVQQLGVAARKAGKEINEQMIDTIADMKTSAMDSIIRVGVMCFVVGVLLGAIVF